MNLCRCRSRELYMYSEIHTSRGRVKQMKIAPHAHVCIDTEKERSIYLCFSLYTDVNIISSSEAHTSVVGGKACGLISRASIMWISLYICLALSIYICLSATTF